MDREFIDAAVHAGFTKEQAKFMDEYLAKSPHEHEMEDINGLEDALEEAGAELEEEFERD